MIKLLCKEVLEATGGELLAGSAEVVFSRISIDSRKIEPGNLYIPIIGERFDGHDFIEGALQAGAAASLTEKDIPLSGDKVVIRVESTLKALRDIAAFYRRKFAIPFIGITGSVGKTSTKDMVASVLGQQFHVLKTQGNFNNEIGLPLTVFNLDCFHEACVLEMGMSGFGEISRLTAIVKPDIAIITNIGMSHIEKLGSRQNILKAKMEILEGLNRDGLVVLNGDDSMLAGFRNLLPFRTVFYGTGEDADYYAYNIETAGENGTHFQVVIERKEYKVHVPVPGIHNVYNALAAIAAGVELKIPMEKILRGIEEFSPSKMRLNIISNNGVKIINDAYNASPQSMEAAINVLEDVGRNGRTIAVLGDMLEMGEWAHEAHLDVGKFAVSKNIDYIITVGENGKTIAQGAVRAGASPDKVRSFEDNEQVNDFMKGFIQQGDTVLVKGSRGMKMEQIVEKLTMSD